MNNAHGSLLEGGPVELLTVLKQMLRLLAVGHIVHDGVEQHAEPFTSMGDEYTSTSRSSPLERRFL